MLGQQRRALWRENPSAARAGDDISLQSQPARDEKHRVHPQDDVRARAKPRRLRFHLQGPARARQDPAQPRGNPTKHAPGDTSGRLARIVSRCYRRVVHLGASFVSERADCPLLAESRDRGPLQAAGKAGREALFHHQLLQSVPALRDCRVGARHVDLRDQP